MASSGCQGTPSFRTEADVEGEMQLPRDGGAEDNAAARESEHDAAGGAAIAAEFGGEPPPASVRSVKRCTLVGF
jgi:hypothetical protein